MMHVFRVCLDPRMAWVLVLPASRREAQTIRPSTAKRHLADLRARSGLTTEQLIYRGRAEGWLVVASLEPG